MPKKPVLIISIVLSIIFLSIILNETPVFHYEPTKYPTTDTSKLIAPEAAPIIYQNGNKRAILFIHGFPSTPKTYLHYAALSKSNGYDVFVPLLPGFGTTKEELKKTCFTQWFAYIKDFYLKYRDQYDEFYVVGLSMGGALTLKLCQVYLGTTPQPTAIAISSTPVFLNNIFEGVLKDPRLFVLRYVSWFIDELPDSSSRPADDGNAEWLGHTGTFPRQTYSLRMGLRDIRQNLDKVSVPISIFHSPKDKVVPYENMGYIARHVSSKTIETNVIPMDNPKLSHHILFMYHSTRDNIYSNFIEFFNRNNKIMQTR